jgi:asparagine synthase (glutamine-hydrolysing)
MALIDTNRPLQLERDVWQSNDACSALNQELAFDWRFTLAESDLPKVCVSSDMAGIEVGFSLLDARLLLFSLKLPSGYKLRGSQLRWFFKEALRGFLPDEILSQKTQGFGPCRLAFGSTATRPAKPWPAIRCTAWRSAVWFGLTSSTPC